MSVYVQMECFCGQSAIGHPKCDGCSIYAGPEHYDRELVGGLCGSCRKRDSLIEARTDDRREMRIKQEMRQVMEMHDRGVRQDIIASSLGLHWRQVERRLTRGRMERKVALRREVSGLPSAAEVRAIYRGEQ